MIDIEKVGLLTELDSLRRGWRACEDERDAARGVNAVLRRRVEQAEATLLAAQAGQRRAWEVIQNLLDSAYPHPVEHPCMFKAWREARKFQEGGSIAAWADTVEPLALSAERLLAELGVTEPGAGDANHEMPVATLMDKLYEAWNNYMRAKHGQPEAIFEPEGELGPEMQTAELKPWVTPEAI